MLLLEGDENDFDLSEESLLDPELIGWFVELMTSEENKNEDFLVTVPLTRTVNREMVGVVRCMVELFVAAVLLVFVVEFVCKVTLGRSSICRL